jgi:hypothetical protein
MSRILLKQLNIVERRSLSTLISNKRVLQQPIRSLNMSNSASANRRLTITKNWLSSSQSKNVIISYFIQRKNGIINPLFLPLYLFRT